MAAMNTETLTANAYDEVNHYASMKPELTPTVTNLTMTAEMFEKLYLTPKTPRAGDNIRRFANPTPLGFVGSFVISAMTFSMVLMGWGGAEGFSALAGMFLFVGPLLLLLTLIFEFLLGNFFSMMVCGLFCVFWLSFGVLQFPTLDLAGAYSSTGSAAEGSASHAFNAVIALYLVVWGFALVTFTIFTLKTNIVFVGMFVTVTAGAWVMSGAYWKVSSGDYGSAHQLETAAGALFFVAGSLGWYITFVIMAAEMRLSTKLPVGDLSQYWARTDRDIAVVEAEA
ncbi:hypothetical protein LTR84_010761 [Exophiala bonariae]|uniref:GPR1/FUN34/YaaH-class plasma membrane protein n=1 Tax=Exophiala bonariae TaxID=1690606 RepID=A0AAV9MUY2_9EURO|nr:hypothetical protein LTR84_010761 [Exophiala bonariae]